MSSPNVPARTNRWAQRLVLGRRILAEQALVRLGYPLERLAGAGGSFRADIRMVLLGEFSVRFLDVRRRRRRIEAERSKRSGTRQGHLVRRCKSGITTNT